MTNPGGQSDATTMFVASSMQVHAKTRQQERTLTRLLLCVLRGSVIDRAMHLHIMRQAESHAHDCDYDNARAVRCDGPGGDLFFVMRTYWKLFSWRRTASVHQMREWALSASSSLPGRLHGTVLNL